MEERLDKVKQFYKAPLICHRICNRNHVTICVYIYEEDRRRRALEDKLVFEEHLKNKQRRAIYDNE